MRIESIVEERASKWLVVFCSSLLLFCLASINGIAQTVDLDFNFRNGSVGWTADFANYPPATNQNGMYELDSRVRFAPRKLTRLPVRAFFLQGHSRSAALTMFLKRRLTASDGVVAGRTYRVEYVMTLASNAPNGCAGIGSPPGEGVHLRAGASPFEPLPVLEPNGWLTLNLDLLTGTTSAGNIANGLDCEVVFPVLPYAYIERTAQFEPVTATANGDLWLFVGTVSGFEGLTRLYYQRITVRLVPR